MPHACPAILGFRIVELSHPDTWHIEGMGLAPIVGGNKKEAQ